MRGAGDRQAGHGAGRLGAPEVGDAEDGTCRRTLVSPLPAASSWQHARS